MWNSESERITDYPVSNSPDSFLSRSPMHGSRSSSLSVSESSLNSDNSLSYDARRRPGKRILKKPHGPRRRSTNRVRWNLPNGENDSDTTSLESFDSSTTTGAIIYRRARNNMLESRQNWRDFEQSPNPGHTGLTPAREAQARNHRNVGRPLSPIQGSIPPHVQLSPQRISQGSTSATGRTFQRSSSPLCNPSSSRNSPSPTPPNITSALLQSPSRLQHSTPIRRCYSDATGLLGSVPPQLRGAQVFDRVQKPATPISQSEPPGTFINFPILKIDESNLPELDTSTPGGKQRAHMFMIPQPHSRHQPQPRQNTPGQSDVRSRRASAPDVYSNYRRYTSQPTKVFLTDDDADDYDHLKPQQELDQTKRSHSPIKEEHSSERENTAAGIGPKQRPSSATYKDEDIDEALLRLSGEDGNESESSPIPSPGAKQPPALPPRGEVSTETVLSSYLTSTDAQRSSSSSLPPPVLPRTAPTPVESNHSFPLKSTSTTSAQCANKKSQDAPPVPPRIRSISHRNPHEQRAHHTQGKYKPLPPLPEVSPSQSPTPGKRDSSHEAENQRMPIAGSEVLTARSVSATQEAPESPEVDDILPPPPEFSGIVPRKELTKAFSSSDDQLASVSDTTLVAADQGESSSHSLVYELKSNPAMFNGLPAEASGEAEHRSHLKSLTTQLGKSSMFSNGGHSDPRSICNHLPRSQFQHTENTNRPLQHRSLHEGRKLGPEMRVIHVPNSGSDSSLDDTTAKVTQTTVRQTRQVKPVSPEPTVTAESRTHLHAQRVQSPEPAGVSRSTTSPRHKVSMEHAYNDGNVMNNGTHQPHPAQSPRSRQRRSSEQAPGIQVDKHTALSRLRRTTSSPQQPKSVINDFAEHLSPEDKKVLQMFYSGGKPPMMRPVIHDTDRTIEDMLAELESEGSEDERNTRKRPQGKWKDSS